MRLFLFLVIIYLIVSFIVKGLAYTIGAAAAFAIAYGLGRLLSYLKKKHDNHHTR